MTHSSEYSHFFHELQSQILGEVRLDSISKHIYSVDASIFEIEPVGIVIPKTKEDLIITIRLASARGIPIIARGAGTGISGGCIGKGLIIDNSKYLNRILDIDIEKGFAVCEPGVVQDELNAALASDGYRLGPDTSTGNRATLGGMVGNNSAGARSLRYGKMVDAVQSVEIILSNGEILQFHSITNEQWERKCLLDNTEGHIYRTIKSIKEQYYSEIEKRFPKIPRRVSGYNLDELIKDENLNISKLIVGSEGTLGVASSIRLKIVPRPKASGLCLLHFNDLLEAAKMVPEILKYDPSALEMIDQQIIEMGRKSPSLRGQLNWLTGDPKAILIVEMEGISSAEVQSKLSAFAQDMKHAIILTDPTSISNVWALRKSGLGILLSKRSYSRAIAFIEDISVSPYKLSAFLEKFVAYLKSKGKSAGIYGHVGAGCIHLRPYINLTKPEEVSLMRQMMLDVSDLLLEFGGAFSGEHGDGLTGSWLLPHMYGEKIMRAFVELKRAFDPGNLMNPGKMVFAAEPFNDLRLSPKTQLKGPETFLNFEPEGGFELAVDLCNGNGQCRKKEGVMCPSFQATDDEFHTTRARAQTLRDVIQGRIPLKDFTGQGVYDVMDLCIECKGCKTECPSQVDMAKMKAEFLYHYHQEHGYPLRSYLFGNIGHLNRWLSFFPKFANKLQKSWISKKGLDFIGITTERSLPSLAPITFSEWLKSYKQEPSGSKKVVLFNDTFTEFNVPDIGIAAMKLLNALGYEVIVPSWSCCGRTLISKGFLKQARSQAEETLGILMPFIKNKIPLISLEPSCFSTIKDDYIGLLPKEKMELARAASSMCFTLDEFLANHLESNGWNLKLIEKKQKVKVHGHCHQKALIGMEATMKVLRSLPGFEVSEIVSGCCGMAGSFGYEKEHYGISMKIGDLKLFPAVRTSAEDTLFIANGTSCRHQILDGTGRHAVHLAEALLSRLE